MKKSLILVSALVVLAVLVGCNADQISGFGKSMEKIGDMGLGTRNNEPMTAAVENVKAFIETSDKCFNWPEDMKFDDPIDESANSVTFIDSTGKQFRDTVANTIDVLLSAKDSSANSKELRSALNAKYSGVTKDAKAEKNVYKLLKRYPHSIVQMMANALGTGEGGHFNPAFARQQLKSYGLNDSAVDALVKILSTDLPMPITTYDDRLIFELIIAKVEDLLRVYYTITGSGGGGGKKLNLTALKEFQEGISASVGSRDYQTVGDKMTFDILYYIIYSLSEVNEKYKASEEYAKLDDFHKYDAFIEFVIENPEGFEFFDRFLNSLQAIGYIYDVKLDVTGLVSGAI